MWCSFYKMILISHVKRHTKQNSEDETEGHFPLQQWLFTLSQMKDWAKLTKGKLKDGCSSCVKAIGSLQEEKQTAERSC